MPVILPAPVYNSRTGHVYELPVETIKAVDDLPLPAGFRREGLPEASFMFSIGVYLAILFRLPPPPHPRRPGAY